MKKLALALSAIIISVSSFANSEIDNVVKQDTTNKVKSGTRTAASGNGTNGSGAYQDTMKRSKSGGKMDRDMGQGTMNDSKAGGKNGRMQEMSSDGIMMKDGVMMVNKNGKTMQMDTEMTLENGMRVMTDGTYIDKNGSTMRMKNGDSMNMAGKIMSMKKPKMQQQFK